MKEIKKCSISGVAFTLELDAFEVLTKYLESLKKTYKDNCDGVEIVADIEARIAELILTQQDNKNIVTKPIIDNILFQMGSVEDISDESSSEEEASNSTPRIPRRLYRDMTNAKLGGVCAGVAKYFDIDTVWIRLGIFVPLLISSTSFFPFMRFTGDFFGNLFSVVVICYVIIWFAVPAARSPRQKLEMEGERITEQSIKNTATMNHDVDARARSIFAEIVSIFGKIILVCIKILLGIILFCFIVTAGGLITSLIPLIFGTSHIFGIESSFTWVSVTGIIVGLIPLIILIYIVIKLIASQKPSGKSVLVLLLLWIISIIACATFALNISRDFSIKESKHEIERILKTNNTKTYKSPNNNWSFTFHKPDSTDLNSTYDDDNSVTITIDGKKIIVSTEKESPSVEIVVDP